MIRELECINEGSDVVSFQSSENIRRAHKHFVAQTHSWRFNLPYYRACSYLNNSQNAITSVYVWFGFGIESFKLMVFFFTQDFIRTTFTDRHMKKFRTTWMIVENVLEQGKSYWIFSSKTQAILLPISFSKAVVLLYFRF